MNSGITNFLFLALVFAGVPFAYSGTAWGLYQIYWGQYGFEGGLRQQMKLTQGRPEYVMFFRDLIRPFPRETIEKNESLGLTTIISLELTVWGGGKDRNYLEEIIAGAFDPYFVSWARSAAAYGKPVIYRFGFEMNGKCFSWGGQPELFKKAWTQVYQIFQKEGADKVQWMFCPSILWGKKTAEKDLFPYYPGDGKVQLVGLDGYNFGDHHDKWHKWTSYEDVFEKSIEIMHRSYQKPLFIGEVGCADDPRKAEWMKNFLENVTRDQRVKAFIYFNYDKRSENEPNWRLDSDIKTLRVFRKWAFKLLSY